MEVKIEYDARAVFHQDVIAEQKIRHEHSVRLRGAVQCSEALA
eukprot:CAMPEP_0118818394 /NCGR_PEP_ID=MMETSP1162-20130426/6128_1 /TAXON_ID=33656 /ORGANISM="Phaeocystis Sp, Strain CCMP2710" /LENGTH=42 /DNA_ID= /DNA_START= /DNA_END= /DNA_ORIENTATION=